MVMARRNPPKALMASTKRVLLLERRFLVKHAEEDDIMHGWKYYFHKMNEQEPHGDVEETDEEENETTRRMEGKPGKLCFTAEEYSTWCLPWMNSLIIKVLGANFPTYVIRDCINRMWRPKDALKLIPLSNGYYIVSFSNKEDWDYAFQESLLPMYMVFGEERPIIYEGLHHVCFTCGKYGHQNNGCLTSKATVNPQDPEQETTETVTGDDGDKLKEKGSGKGVGGDPSQIVTQRSPEDKHDRTTGLKKEKSPILMENKGGLTVVNGPKKSEWVPVGSKRKNGSKGKAKGKENFPPAKLVERKAPLGHGSKSITPNSFAILQNLEA
ncbi:hypothetical protein K1719_022798 [Acacia pycnantha]|nr:hypothetical protein K1719_022798 [Acacia pycnantha]